MNEAMTAVAPDKEAIRSELEATRTAYGVLVEQVGHANWKRPSGIPAWTCGQLAWHVASSVAFMAGQTEGAMKGKALNPPAFLLPVLFKMSEVRVRFASRKATPASVRADMDTGMTRLLALLDATDPAALATSATAFGETRTIAEMFRLPVTHLAEHAAHIRSALDR